ncbi:MAG: hypothetical protein JO104_10975 [Candidatus Eremiobacteraeota bacterium]|nr:hypothetical protein [Candidatus Eremiobacteraeota bacterium]
MNAAAADQALLQIVNRPGANTIADVVAKIEAINDSLPSNDGLKWFNLLYLNVTQKVDGQPPPDGWKDPSWLARLDVVFAQLYFDAIAGWLQGSAGVPASWKALFESRFRGGIDRIQFALAGMNAHINHDLALALLQTDANLNLTPIKGSAEHDDFEHVNALLEAALPQALQFLATGLLGEAAQDTGKIGRLLAIWKVRAARDLAWEVADTLRPLNGVARNVALAAQDQITGVLGRSLLL